jgi:hypothetical protein
MRATACKVRRAAGEKLDPGRCPAEPDVMATPVATTEPAISDPLTWQQICARYPDQWVALVDIDWVTENDLDFRSARVACHGATRREPLDQARPLRARYDEIGHFFTGPIRPPLRSYLLP